MSSLLKKLSISIKIHVVKPLWSLFGHWSVSKLLTESVGSRRELVANCVYDADATQLDSYVASASAVCIGHYTSYLYNSLLQRSNCSKTARGSSSVYGRIEARALYVALGGDPPQSLCGRG